MTRILLVALSILVSVACQGVRHIPRETLVRGIDFTKYTQQGFLFTTGDYGGSYESIGLVFVSMYGEATIDPRTNQWKHTPVSLDDVLAEAHKRAVEMGANGIIKLEMRSIEKRVGFITVPGVEVAGFAVRLVRSPSG